MFMKIAKYLILSVVLLNTSYVIVTAQGIYKAWEARYDGTGSARDFVEGFALDQIGFLYVTGPSMGPGNGDDYQEFDYATVKISPNGDTVWARRFNGPANGVDYANDVAVDKDGFVYVTGFSKSPETFIDYFTIKYSPLGNTVWTRRFDGFGSDDHAQALVVDDSGNVIVTGYSFAPETGADFLTIKYSALGELQWAKRYTGPGRDWDQAYSIMLGDSGTIYVAGRSKRRITYEYDWDFTVIKYNPNGDTLWIRFYDGPSHFQEDPPALAKDNLGYVYIAGASRDSLNSFDFATIKFTPSGDSIWVRRYDSPLHGYDVPTCIAIDPSGNVYVSGFGNSDFSTGNYFNTIKYDSGGNQLWVKRHGSGYSIPSSITADRDGNVYVTGSSNEGTMDYLTVKYLSDGNIEWAERYNGPDSFSDGASSVLLDELGNIYVCGSSQSATSTNDYLIIKYAPIVTKVDEGENTQISRIWALSQNYPNPFNASTVIRFTLPASGKVELDVFNILGQNIKTLADQNLSAGYQQIIWDGTDQSGNKVASGIYFYRLKTDSFSETKKMVFLK